MIASFAPILQQEAPIFGVLCDEPEGKVTRYVTPFRLSRDNIRKFWEKASKFPTLFTDDVKGDFKKFCELFISEEDGIVRAHGLFWVIDDFVGMFYMTHITDVDAVAHYTFFDRRQTGREELTKTMLRYAFEKFGFRRISTEVPKYANKHTVGFVQAVGFVQEGIKRKAAFYKGEWYDIRCYSVLREEIITDAK
jgi:RimJ/RimL family protein N-acetyltransferase